MNQEISCAFTKSLMAFIDQQPADVRQGLLEGFEEKFLTADDQWISYQAANTLSLRAETLTGDRNLFREIGQQAFQPGQWANQMLLAPITSGSLLKGLNYFLQKKNLWEGISECRLEARDAQQAVLERKMRSGYICTRSACGFFEGLLRGLISAWKLRDFQLVETHCAVPIWEKGLIDQNRFILVQGHIGRENLQEHSMEDLGPLYPDGSFRYLGTLYGAPSCQYHIAWIDEAKKLKKAFHSLVFRLGYSRKLQRESLKRDQWLEKQRWELQTDLIRELQKEKSQSIKKYEADLAEQKKLVEHIQGRLNEWDGMKYYFLSITSHELRTPLTIIKGALHLIQSEGKQLSVEVYQKYLKMALRNTERLIKILNDILNFSRLQFGHLKLELSRVDMVRLIRETIEEFRDEADKCLLQITSDLPARPLWCIGDQDRLKQILNNLLSNAIKFTPRGGKILIGLRPIGDYLEMVFQDTGVGIAEKDQRKIFAKFQQIEDTLSRENGGVGLGLAIVKDLLDLHDGKIWLESEVGKGSKFKIHLPLAGPKNPEKVAKKNKRLDGQPPLILNNK